MKWNDHSRDIPEGAHAFLGASKYSWLNYTEEKLIESYNNFLAKERGVKLHALACQLIKLKQKLPSSRKTLNMYVNDSIGYDMTPEQGLYYSSNCFGTADAIGFRRNILRVHDLKTGITPASMHQLEIYAALFCLEYNITPGLLSDCELRIYQNDSVIVEHAEPDLILPIMDKIKIFSKRIEKLKEDGYGY